MNHFRITGWYRTGKISVVFPFFVIQRFQNSSAFSDSALSVSIVTYEMLIRIKKVKQEKIQLTVIYFSPEEVTDVELIQPAGKHYT